MLINDLLNVFNSLFTVVEFSAEDIRISAHEKLGEVLRILKAVLQKYPALHTTDVLTAAAVLITRIKSNHISI